MKLIRAVSIAVIALLAACVAPQSPQQSVFQTKSAYEGALITATAYKRLPLCATPAVQPCSQKAVVVQLQKADDVAAKALDAAETAVRTPGFGESILQSAMTAAKAALDAFVAITSTLQAK